MEANKVVKLVNYKTAQKKSFEHMKGYSAKKLYPGKYIVKGREYIIN